MVRYLCCFQVTNWSGTCYIFPLLGAFIADSYLGRYRTIIIFSIIYIIVSQRNDFLMHSYHIVSCLSSCDCKSSSLPSCDLQPDT